MNDTDILACSRLGPKNLNSLDIDDLTNDLNEAGRQPVLCGAHFLLLLSVHTTFDSQFSGVVIIPGNRWIIYLHYYGRFLF